MSYIPYGRQVHTQPYYKKFGFEHDDFPVAGAYYEETVSIPIYARLTDEEQSKEIDALKQVLK